MATDRKALNPLLKWLWDLLSFYSVEEIRVPTGYHEQVAEIKDVLMSDTSGIVSSLLDFAINAACVDYTVEAENENFGELIEKWLSQINMSLIGKIPVGVRGLSKEYFRERWKNSSMLLLRTIWEKVDIDGTTMNLPTKMWFIDGANIVVEDGSETRIIGEEEYALKLSETESRPLPASKEELIFIQKPFNSWSDLYSTPFLIQRGLWRNLKLFDLLNRKSERFIAKAMEYLLLFKHGTEQLSLKGSPEFTYSEEDLKKAKDDLKTVLSNNSTEPGTPVYSTNFDSTFEHVIPDYTKMMSEALYAPIERRLLAGLGLVEIVEGVASTRREGILNPKPFIREIENGIQDFIALLMDVMLVIQQKNQDSHPKYFGEEIQLHYSPLRDFISDSIRDHLRSMYDRGIVSKQTYTEVIGGVDFDIEVTRRKTETSQKLDDTMYPPVVTNQEQYPDMNKPQPNPTAPKTEKTLPEKKSGPEAKNFQGDIGSLLTDVEQIKKLEILKKQETLLDKLLQP